VLLPCGHIAVIVPQIGQPVLLCGVTGMYMDPQYILLMRLKELSGDSRQ
jgi:hypothetical protein